MYIYEDDDLTCTFLISYFQGRTITTEDAFMLRRKATARLARMEKEFTSTVVLTENETLLINETNNDKKRRCTKLPKRYEFYDDETDDEQRKNSPKKTALTTIDNEKNLAVEVKEIREPVYIQDTILDQLKHCTVNLIRLENMENVAPWCMVHQLYKCFCKGKSLEGKPMIIEKDENNTTIEHGGEEDQQHQLGEMDYKMHTTKARYTFEKVEKKKSYNNESDEESDDNEVYTKYETRKPKQPKGEMEKNICNIEKESDKKSDLDSKELPDAHKTDSLLAVSHIEKEKPKRSLEEVRERFYASRPECCRRQIPIPRRMFLYCNRKRRLNVLKFIKEHETEKTRLLLNEHVMRSVYYHKTDAEKARKQQEKHLAKVNEIEKQNNIMDEKQKEDSLESTSKNDENKHSFELPISRMDSSECEDVKPKVSEIVDLLDDVEEMKSVNKLSNDINLTTAKQSPAQDENNCAVHNSVITVKNFGTLSSINVEEDCTPPSQTNDSATSSIIERQELMLPKISNCFSLNANANSSEKSLNSPSDVQKLQQHLADLTSATSVNSPAFTTTNSANSSKTIASSVQPVNDTSTIDTQIPPNLDSESVRDVYNSVIRTMNTLVSKKMQDVDFALRRESHIIPAPNADILCIMKWSNFLDAYCHGFAFIWQVKSKEGTYLVATIRNMMPMICEAMGVVNITALKPERVPLMGRMLLNNIRNEHTTKLAVVMQGKLSYWVVKGFLKADPSMACNKPTPETHPSLTKKINVLCTSLVKQRQKEEKKKEHLQAPKRSNTNQMLASSTNINSQQHTTTTLHQSLLPAPPLPLQTAPLPLYQQQVQVVSHKTISPIQHPSSNHQEQHQIVVPQNTIPASHTVPFVPTDNLATKSNQAHFTDPTPQSRKRKSTGIVTDITSNGITPTKMDSYAKMSTNIEFRKVTPQDINEIHLPEIHKRNHKWLVLDLHNDFSHIFVPDFRDLVSLDRIQKVINFAKQKNKIVKLQFFQNAPFDAFVTPKSGRKIYFGPLNLEMKPPTLILLQSVDGQMMLRELYQMKHNIHKGLDEKTKAFWLLQMNGQTHFEVDHNQGNAESNSFNSNSNVVEQLVVEDEDDDEDCMIIDEVTQITPPTEQQQQQPPLNEGRFNFTIGSMPNDTTITIMPQTNSLPGPPPIQTLINSKATATNGAGGTASLLKIANTNTIIKPIVQMPLVNQTPPSLMTLPSNTVITGLTPVSASNVSTIATTTNTPATTPLLLSNAVVTGITPTAPQDAAYGSTIFISPSPAAPSKVNTNLSMPRPPLTTGANQMSMASVHHTKQPALGTSNDSSYRPAPIAKRRRVSVVCHNPYDKISQNIAVNAVINKILPENIQDIQVNQSLETLKTVSTIGSTTITKISDSNNDQQRSTATGAGGSCSTGNQEQKISPSKPLVFDVSFVDGGDDEPTASIVIKPTPSPTKVSTPTSLPSPNTTTMSSTSSLTERVENAKLCMKTNRSVPYKVIKIPVSSSSTIATGGQAQLLNKIIYTKTTNNPVSSSPSSTVVRQQQQPGNSTSVLTKKLLNTTNPIKITGITTIPASKATIPVRIAPKPLTCTTNTSTSNVKSLTISSINATSHINSITKATPLSVSYAKTLTTTSTTPAPLVSSSSTATTVPSQQRQLPTTNSTIASTSTLNSAKSSGLAITIVQSFGTVPTPRTNKNNVIINNVQSLTASSSTATAVQQRNNSNSCKVDKFSCGNIKSTEALSSSLVSPSSSKTSKKKVDGRDNADNLVLPPHIQYGYIVSPIYNEYKFVAKKVSEEFYVKVPSVGILKLIGLQAVHNYLNK